MPEALTYNLLPRAIAWREDERAFMGAAVRGVVFGFVDSDGYKRIAGEAQDRLPSPELAGRVARLLAADANPIVPLLLDAGTVDGVAARWNALHAVWHVGIDTRVQCASGGAWDVTRRSLSQADSPLQQRIILACLAALRQGLLRGPSEGRAWAQQLTGGELGDSAVAACADVLSGLGMGLSLTQAARRLGCSSRTLQRELQGFGLTFPVLRGAGRLIGAASRIRACPQLSLTELALEFGFSDSAHFANCFRRSTGVRPSDYARIAAV